MAPLTLVYREDGALHPMTQDDAQALTKRFGEGDLIETELKPIASRGQKRFWAMVNAAYKWGDFNKWWETPELMGDAVKIAAKHRRMGKTIGGQVYWSALSLAEVKDWNAFNEVVEAVLKEKLEVPAEVIAPPAQDPEGRESVTPKAGSDFDEMIDKIIRFCSDQETFVGMQPDQLKALEALERQWKEEIQDSRMVTVFSYARQLVLARHQNNNKAMADLRKILRGMKGATA
jgi:hypothetical protein